MGCDCTCAVSVLCCPQVKVLCGGWFIKKGKSKTKDDSQRRWIELVDVPSPALNYYAEFDEEL